jgi:ornithine carbamoyltransferase
MKKDFLSVKDFSAQEIAGIFTLTDSLKKNPAKFARALSGKSIALIFQKPSNRTRVSFEVGMYELGGHSVYLAPHEINLGVRESIDDVAKTLSRYVQGIVLRTFEHKNCLVMAEAAGVPVINGLSDFEHPCQALADIYTLREKFKPLKGRTIAYIGDGNNVCNSLLLAAAACGVASRVGCPKGYEPDAGIVRFSGAKVFNQAAEAAKGADCLYTDVWASMGQEKEAEERKKIFRDFQVNASLLAQANKGAVLMHCLPAHRGEEVTADVIDSPASVVFDQAENRMHVQKAILIKLLKKAR